LRGIKIGPRNRESERTDMDLNTEIERGTKGGTRVERGRRMGEEGMRD